METSKTTEGYMAEFAFGPSERSPEIPKGSYTMNVDYTPETGKIKMEGENWLEQPENYIFADLVGSEDT